MGFTVSIRRSIRCRASAGSAPLTVLIAHSRLVVHQGRPFGHWQRSDEIAADWGKAVERHRCDAGPTIRHPGFPFPSAGGSSLSESSRADGRFRVKGGCRRQVDGTAGPPSAPEMPFAPRQLRLVPRAVIQPRLDLYQGWVAEHVRPR